MYKMTYITISIMMTIILLSEVLSNQTNNLENVPAEREIYNNHVYIPIIVGFFMV